MGHEDLDDLRFQQVAQFRAAFDGLAASAFAEGIEDFGRGLYADVAHDQRGFEIFERRLIDLAGERDDVVDACGKRLAGARDGLAHAREESRFTRRLFVVCLGFLFFLFIFRFFVVAGE